MKLDANNMKVTTEGISNQHSFSLSADGMTHLMQILTNLYSNRELACIREFSTNAMDSHIAAGKPDLPIRITLPTRLSPNFIVEDFGVGLSKQEVFDIYTTYGESTKRDSDEYNGQLGLGSKSAFTYCQQFLLTAIKNGNKIIVALYIGEDGVPKASILDETLTDEQNGVKIEIPVKNVSDFNEEAKNFYLFFEPTPVFVNASEHFDSMLKNCKNIFDRIGNAFVASSYSATNYYLTSGVYIRMGNVLYPVDKHYSTSRTLIIILDAPIGAVSFTPSRESLLYNNKTKNYIKKSLEEFFVSLMDVYESTIKEKTSSFDMYTFSRKFYIEPSTYNRELADLNIEVKDELAKRVKNSTDLFLKLSNQVRLTLFHISGYEYFKKNGQMKLDFKKQFNSIFEFAGHKENSNSVKILKFDRLVKRTKLVRHLKTYIRENNIECVVFTGDVPLIQSFNQKPFSSIELDEMFNKQTQSFNHIVEFFNDPEMVVNVSHIIDNYKPDIVRRENKGEASLEEFMPVVNQNVQRSSYGSFFRTLVNLEHSDSPLKYTGPKEFILLETESSKIKINDHDASFPEFSTFANDVLTFLDSHYKIYRITGRAKDRRDLLSFLIDEGFEYLTLNEAINKTLDKMNNELNLEQYLTVGVLYPANKSYGYYNVQNYEMQWILNFVTLFVSIYGVEEYKKFVDILVNKNQNDIDLLVNFSKALIKYSDKTILYNYPPDRVKPFLSTLSNFKYKVTTEIKFYESLKTQCREFHEKNSKVFTIISAFSNLFESMKNNNLIDKKSVLKDFIDIISVI